MRKKKKKKKKKKTSDITKTKVETIKCKNVLDKNM
jgi:hypothetical protein